VDTSGLFGAGLQKYEYEHADDLEQVNHVGGSCQSFVAAVEEERLGGTLKPPPTHIHTHRCL
jgi:hypothetical protein